MSLLGDGSSLAMTGASTLAAELAGTSDVALALRRYEAEHRKLTGPKQNAAGPAAGLLIPATRAGLVVRNAATRLWPLAAAAQWTTRQLSHQGAA
jgi:2-polyprenyl-6-methoxyphenol hydroxylase-like FAD-dependent oxidoreductase